MKTIHSVVLAVIVALSTGRPALANTVTVSNAAELGAAISTAQHVAATAAGDRAGRHRDSVTTEPAAATA